QRIGDQRGDRQHLDLVDLLLRWKRQRVGEYDAADRGVLQPVDGRPAEHSVRGHGPHLGGAALQQDVGGAGDGAAAVDHVVGEDAQPAVDVADHFFGFRLIDAALRSAFVDEGQVGAEVTEVFGHARCDLDATGVGRHDDGFVRVLTNVV